MKKLTLCLFALLITFKANAQYPYKYNFEFYYQDNLVETEGNYFLTEALILPNKDLFQSNNKNILNAFRNTYTACRQKNINWLNLNIKGSANNKKELIELLLTKFNKDLYVMHGYAVFNKYSIILLEKRNADLKLILAFEYDQKTDQYYLNADFKTSYPTPFNVIDQAFKGNGEFKILKDN